MSERLSFLGRLFNAARRAWFGEHERLICLVVKGDRILLMDEDGVALSHEEMTAFMEKVQASYASFRPDQIAAINAAIEKGEHKLEIEVLEMQRGMPVWDRPGYIYLLRAPNGIYKIGRRKRGSNRMAAYQTHAPGTELIHEVYVSDMVWAETYLHRAYASLRHGDTKEWFDLNEDHVRWIKSLESF